MVAFGRIGEGVETARCCPVEFPAVDDDASEDGAVSADPLRCAVRDNVRAVIEGTDEVSYRAGSVMRFDGVQHNLPPMPKVLSTRRGIPLSWAT